MCIFDCQGTFVMLASIVLFALQAAAVAAAPAAVVAPAATAPTAVAAAVPHPDDKVICKDEDTVGTRLGGHKVCMTRGQWRVAAAQDRDLVKHAQENIGYAHQ
jgi:hypothetical protein